ncbi:Bromodomain [Macleaya cordata]|uniref:Bromodomain n=1 Tax=Macleaya cordata TaxID=56857 RepID=A0A200R4C1_MACCD|nr:Bromodomain [Macleaya cordata]
MAPTVLVEYTRQKELLKRTQEVSVPMMGKTQRISRGSSTGFVPDYRHVVETMAESEGLGSSGRLDTERTASEDSCAPKRKCISLNVDRSDGFGIPVEVISLSKMSRSEKKELELRLKSELEQVQTLQKKFSLRPPNVNTLSACSDGQKRAPTLQKSSELLSGQEKKGVPPGRNGHHLKRGSSGRFESVKQVPPSSTSNLKLMKQCEALLKRLSSHPYGWVFNTPVDIVKLEIPDYFSVIKHPMDLGTVQSKIDKGEYSSPLGFLADVRLTFSNAMTYNPPGNDVHVMADQLSKFFETRWKSIEKKLPVHDSVPVPVQLGVAREMVAAKSIPPSKKRKISLTSHELKTEPVKRIMSDEDKHNLSRDLESLIVELPVHIIEFLQKHSFGASQAGEDEIEVDIDDLSDDALFTLRKLVDDYMREKQANHAKAEPCEIEILNVSGLSNSSMQPCKGNDPVDEDVDIGGNDPPVSSYPPVEIDKDTAHRSSKCSSSSSSSSDSGSSSSDSDSGSSSASDSDHARASSPVNATKEVLGSGETLDQQTNGVVDPHDGNQPVSGLDQVDQSSQPKPLSVEVDSQQEGESAPSERQVSPEKLYRAAWLRGRFADTILKAREKTLNQGEKGDPEKLRREREELEKQQREEKARLQAEAKAAEDARRQAEAEAAAEAKRKRELEREAARQALLQMEKTVEINEGSQFLEDLEMLRAAPTVHLPSVDEMSQDQSQDAMGCFNFEGSSNPLEQLGLYMKMDEDEEEEVAPNSVPEQSPPPPPVQHDEWKMENLYSQEPLHSFKSTWQLGRTAGRRFITINFSFGGGAGMSSAFCWRWRERSEKSSVIAPPVDTCESFQKRFSDFLSSQKGNTSANFVPQPSIQSKRCNPKPRFGSCAHGSLLQFLIIYKPYDIHMVSMLNRRVWVAYLGVFRNWSPKHRPEASSCFISFAHGTPAVLLSTFAIATHSQRGFAALNTDFQNMVLDFSIAYFLMDLLHYLIFFPSDILFIGHHLATLFVFVTCRYLVFHGAFAILILLILAEMGAYYLSGEADNVIPRWVWVSWMVVVIGEESEIEDAGGKTLKQLSINSGLDSVVAIWVCDIISVANYGSKAE